MQQEGKELFKVKSVYVVDYATTPPLEFNVGWPAASDQLLYARVRPWRLRQPQETTTPGPLLSLTTNYIHIEVTC